MSSTRTRNLQLDVLRGVAILLVFGRHLELSRPAGPVGVLADVWYRIGWIGVDLFFVLSGFLIGGLLITELQQRGAINVGRFLIRRGLKLYPAYLVFIGYLMLMPAAKAMVRGDDAWAAFSSMFAQSWPNLLFLQNYLWTVAGHTWSLAVEEHFYLLLPFALVALATTGRVRRLVPLYFAMAPVFLGLRILSIVFDDRFAEFMAASHLRLDGLLCGVGIRAVAQFYPSQFQALREWRGVLLLAGVLMWLPNVFVEPSTVFIRTLGLTATFLGSAAFLIAAYQTTGDDFGAARKLVQPVASLLAWIGVYSYGIYLWHVTVFGILLREVGARVTGLLGVTSAAWLIGAVAVCAGAVIAGAIATRVVEVPILRLRDRFFPSRATALSGDSARRSAEMNHTVSIAAPVTYVPDKEPV